MAHRTRRSYWHTTQAKCVLVPVLPAYPIHYVACCDEDSVGTLPSTQILHGTARIFRCLLRRAKCSGTVEYFAGSEYLMVLERILGTP